MNIGNRIKLAFTKKRSMNVLFKDLYSNATGWKSILNTATSQLGVYASSLYVYACVKVRGEKTSELLDFKVINKKTKKEVENSNLVNVLNKPNEYQTKEEFFERYQTYKDLTGSVFVYVIRKGEDNISGDIQSFYLLQPDYITIQMNDDNTAIAGFKSSDPNLAKKEYKPEEIIFSLTPNPLSALQGLSPLRPGAYSIDTEKQLCEYQNKVLKNGGKVEGIFTFKIDTLTKQQLEELKEKYNEQYAEAKKSGNPLFLGGDSKYEKLALTPTELSYLETKNINRNDVFVLYKVPKTLLGLTDGVQKGNYEETERMFIKNTVYPLIRNLVAKFNTLTEDNEILISPDPTPEDTEAVNSKIESGGTHHYMTINEMRDLQGLDPLSEGDVILVPFGLTELGSEPDLPKE
jgi:HK97 family phage portal protein